MDIVLLIPVLFFSVIVHEFAHGFVAYRMGDDTAYLSGRLTLNPLPHIDPVGTLLIPAACFVMGLPMFGWAKPVPVNMMRFVSPRRDMGKVAVAGPAVNFILAVVFLLLLKGLSLVPGATQQPVLAAAAVALQYGVLVNILLAVFNLMPIPPLDGGQLLVSVLPFNAAMRYEGFFRRYGLFIIIGLLLTGAFKYILYPPVMFILNLFNHIL